MRSPVRQMRRLGNIKKELSEIYMNQVIQTFALALIGIFIPIYILRAGFSFNTTLLFMIISWGSLALLAPFCAKFASRIGLKRTILLRSPILMIYLFLLIYIDVMSISLLYLTALIGGISFCLYWIPINSEFVKNTDRLHIGHQIGLLMAFPRIAAIFAPLIGGIILEVLGFSSLFIMVLVLIVISVIPLFMTADYKSSFDFGMKDTMINPRHKLSLAFFVQGLIHMTEIMMWPLFIFLTLGDILIVGIAGSISAMGVALFTIIIGKASDRIDKRNILIIGAIGYSIIWFVRGFSFSLIDIMLLSFMGGLFDSLINIPIFSLFCDKTRDKNILAYVASREMWLGIGRIIPLILIVVFAVQSVFFTMFLVAGIITLALIVFAIAQPGGSAVGNYNMAKKRRMNKPIKPI